MLFSVKTDTPGLAVTRRIAIQDGRLSAAMGQLSLRLGARDAADGKESSTNLSEFEWQFQGIDDTLRRLSENLIAAQETLSTLDGVDDVLGDIGELVSQALIPDLPLERRVYLQERVDLLRPRFAALDNLDLSTPTTALASQRTVDRAYEALFDFRRQVDGILVNLESAAENLRLAAAAWSPTMSPALASSNVRVISESIRQMPKAALSAQARTETGSALVLLKP
jgi:hypothetical protein